MPLNLLQIIPQLDTGGAERTTLEIAEAIVKDGGDALVFTNGGRMLKDLERSGAKAIIGNAKSKNPFTILFINTAKICGIIREFKIDIIHARSRAPAISALLAARICKIPFVTTYHGIYNSNHPLKRYYNGIMTKGDVIIANSNFTKSHLIGEHKIDPSKVQTIYRGVDLERFDPEKMPPQKKCEMLDKWGLVENDHIKILLPARLTNWKGQKVLIEAANILNKKGIVAQYILAGEDQGRTQYTQELLAMTRNYGISENFHFIGHENDIPAAMYASDIIVTPSIEPEAFGRTAAEAGAMGKPVIATNIGGAKEVVTHGETGFLIETANADQLANYIEELILMGEKGRKIIGERAMKRIREKFPTKSLQQKTLQLYYELLNPKQ